MLRDFEQTRAGGRPHREGVAGGPNGLAALRAHALHEGVRALALHQGHRASSKAGAGHAGAEAAWCFPSQLHHAVLLGPRDHVRWSGMGDVCRGGFAL